MVDIVYPAVFLRTTMRAHASWAFCFWACFVGHSLGFPLGLQVEQNSSVVLKAPLSCDGRRIFMLTLPTRFNEDLLYNESRDRDIPVDWYTKAMLRHLEAAGKNKGFGAQIPAVAGPESLSTSWYHTDQNAMEVIFHSRMLSYPCKAQSHEEADMIYVPYFGGADSLRTMHRSTHDRDDLARNLVAFLKEQLSWAKENGSDHFMVLGRNVWDFSRPGSRGWGSNLLNIEGMKDNVWIVCTETFPSFERVISSPKPTTFHPKKWQEMADWMDFVRNKERSWLFAIVGGHRGLETEEGVMREKLFWQCKTSPTCKLLDCSRSSGEACHRESQVLGLYLDAKFCLHPVGDACSRRSVIDASLSGCIPVVFKKCTFDEQFQWHIGPDKEGMFVHIPMESVMGPTGLNTSMVPYLQGGTVLVEDVLQSFLPEDAINMQSRVIDIIPHITYGGMPEDASILAPDFKDAVDIIVENLLKSSARLKSG